MNSDFLRIFISFDLNRHRSVSVCSWEEYITPSRKVSFEFFGLFFVFSQEEISRGKDGEEKESSLPLPHWICQPYVRPVWVTDAVTHMRFCPDQRVGVRNIWLSWSDPLSTGQKNLLSMVTARGQRSRSPCVRRDHWKTPTGLRTCSPKTSWRKGPATPTRTSVLSRNVSWTLPGPPPPFLTTVFLIFYQKMKKKNCFFFSSAKYIKCEQCGNPKVGSTRVILQYQTAGSRLFFFIFLFFFWH